MTEAEWLACDDPTRMLEFLGNGGTGRQFMLFSLACWRRLWPVVPDESREIIHKIEAVLEGAAVELESIPWTVACMGSYSCVWEVPEPEDVMHTSWSFARGVAEAIPRAASGGDSKELEEVARRYHRRLLDCIFGNPFRPVVLTPTWQTANVVALAQAVYADRDFDRLPILADALEDAGCTDTAILDHCRQPGEHARGCWVVDLILGKS